MMKNRKLVKGIALAAVITALAAGGTAAYLTDFETATNSFTVGKVDIDLDEPNWKPEDNTDLVPTQVIRKDPYVANKGVNEAFVYLEVSVPVRNVITVAKDGTRNAAWQKQSCSASPKTRTGHSWSGPKWGRIWSTPMHITTS